MIARPPAIQRRSWLGLLLLGGLAAILGTGNNGPGGSGTGAGAPTWAKSYGGGTDDEAAAVVATGDGGALFAGTRAQPAGGGGGDVWVARLDAFGDVLWQRTLGDNLPASGLEVAAEAPDGTIWVGLVEAASQGSAALGRYTADGGFIDRRPIPLPDEHPQHPRWDPAVGPEYRIRELRPTSDGGVLLGAFALWELRLVEQDGAAISSFPADAQTIYVAKFDAGLNPVWSAVVTAGQFDGFNYNSNALHIVETAGGGAVVAMNTRIGGERGVRLIRYGPGGGVDWISPLELTEADALIRIDGDLDGVSDDGLLLVGTDYPDAGPFGLVAGEQNGVMVRISAATGAEQWRRQTRGYTLNRVVEQCGDDGTGYDCLYHAAGVGHLRGNLPGQAFLLSVDRDGRVVREVDYPDIESFQALMVLPGTSTLAAIAHPIGDGRPGAVSLQIDAELRELSREQSSEFMWFGSFTRNGELLEASGGTLQRSARNGTLHWHVDVEAQLGGVDRVHALIETRAGDYVVAALQEGVAEGGQPWLIGLSAQGAVQWQRRLDGEYVYPADRRAGALAAADDGGFALAVWDGFFGGGRLVRFDSGGIPLWLVPAGPRVSAREEGGVEALAALPDGGYVVAGSDPAGGSWFERFDASGQSLARQQYGPALRLTSVRPLPQGGFVAGAIAGAGVPTALWLDDQGVLQSARRYLFTDGAVAGPGTFAAPLPDGGFLLGTSVDRTPAAAEGAAQFAFGRRNYLLIRLDEAGEVRWHRILGAREDETLHDLIVLPDGGALLAGRSDSMGDYSEAWLVRVGPDGRVALGCNAALDEEATLLSQAVAFQSDGFRSSIFGATDTIATIETVLAPRAPADVVVARQCSGTAQPDGPRPPADNAFTLTVAQGGALRGVVTSTPAGIVCGTAGGEVCSAAFAAGTTVLLEPDPGSLSDLARWDGCDEVIGAVCRVTLDTDREVTVFFEEMARFALSFSVSGNGDVQSGDGQIRCGASLGDACSGLYGNGVTVRVSAVAAAGEALLGWGGDCASFGAAIEIDVLMDSARQCTAAFSGEVPIPTHSLTIDVTANDVPTTDPAVGQIASAPAGIQCPGSCIAGFPIDSEVVLSATGANGWVFHRFVCPDAADEDFNQARATILMDQDERCAARFRNDMARIGVSFNAPNTGRVTSEPSGLDCTSDCSWPFFTSQGPILLNAVDVAGNHRFDRWLGCDSVFVPAPGANEVCQVSGQQSTNVHASFVPISGPEPRLTVQSADTAGSGRITSSPAGIDCGLQCSAGFPLFEVVALTATPDPGSVFSRWNGDADCSDGVVTMDADRFCEAVFLPSGGSFMLTIASVTGPGRVQGGAGAIDCPGRCSASFAENSQVIVFADTTVPGASFDGWGGDCAPFGTLTGLNLTMNRDYVCSAAFSP